LYRKQDYLLDNETLKENEKVEFYKIANKTYPLKKGWLLIIN